MPDQNIAPAAAPGTNGTTTPAPSAAGTTSPPASHQGTKGGGPAEAGTPTPSPISTESLAAAVGRQLAGEPYTLNAAGAAPGKESSPGAEEAGRSAEVAGPEGTDPNENGSEGAGEGGSEEEADAEPTGNPAWAALRVEAKKAKAEVKRLQTELEEAKAKLTEAATTDPKLETRNTEPSSMELPAHPELAQVLKDEGDQRNLVSWSRKALSRLQTGFRNEGADTVLAELRAELGEQGAKIPQDPNAALDWLDSIHAGAVERLYDISAQKHVLQREIQRAVLEVRQDAREFAETVMPALFEKGTPEAALMAQAKQVFPGIEKNPLFYTWVVKAIRGHQAIEAEARGKVRGEKGEGRPPLKPIQVPGAKPLARLPGATSHLPARAAENQVNGSSYWMGQMRQAKTAGERDAAKAEWQKALAHETQAGMQMA